MSEKRIEGGSPEYLAESHSICSYSVSFLVLPSHNSIMKVDESSPHLQSTSKSWAVKQRKMCPKASRPET